MDLAAKKQALETSLERAAELLGDKSEAKRS